MATEPAHDLTEDEEPSAQGLNHDFLRDHIQGAASADAAGGPAHESADEPAAPPPALIEDEPPSPTGLNTEHWLRISKQRHMNETRTRLATGLFWLVSVLAIVPSLALVFARWTHFTADAYRELGLVFTPVVALASAAFGFFFASDERNRDL
ncbi:hypothetical protein GCM10018793_29690 [Streptomyces sulfonofaciens]|uniref:Uncharacterized protein n=1 Tax=Streptomyces sulfonofaciens TaxID=68272 RepID=A0A919G760_9ACTN|nr:hypothetical protein [Streptomyces sulfonofaciens]GHH78648.1 hypothetical protein GCM10018793_29690 [Streptomyces sulfonofaciens]